MSEALLELGEMIAMAQADTVLGHDLAHGELTVIATPSGLRELVGHLRDHTACAFTTLIDITAIDWPGRDARFDVVYHFLSMPQNQRVRVKIAVVEGQVVPSINDIHPSANWYEREIYDLLGVDFEQAREDRPHAVFLEQPGKRHAILGICHMALRQ